MTKKKETTTAAGETKEPQETKEAEDSQESKETTQVPEKVKTLEVCAPNGLNLRSGPHKSYPLVGVLVNGARVTPLELPAGIEVPGWTPVDTPAGRGWVMTEFLRQPEEP